jgi:hypothetical protein
MAGQDSSLDIKLDRFDRVYRPGETVKGSVIINVPKKAWSHSGVQFSAKGTIHTVLQSSGLMSTSEEAVERTLYSHMEELVPEGTAQLGSTEVPFEFRLTGKDLLESYHGVYVSVIYSISVSCDRGMLRHALKREIEFILEMPMQAQPEAKLVIFNISPASLENVDKEALKNIPAFNISGRLHRSNCSINRPFTGEVMINSSVSAIRSLELQLARIESVHDEKKGQFQQEASEVMRIQIAEGNLCRDMVVPIYMVFPRLHSCPTLKTTLFKIEFEINLIIIFDDGHVVTENFPITISRD